jgi:hypothetical protein
MIIRLEMSVNSWWMIELNKRSPSIPNICHRSARPEQPSPGYPQRVFPVGFIPLASYVAGLLP